MPKVQLTPITRTMQTVQRNIESRGALFGLKTERDFAARFGIAPATYHDKKVAPRKWTLEQLAIAAAALKVPLSWLVTDHSGEIKEERQ